jgi:hypothetical protein
MTGRASARTLVRTAPDPVHDRAMVERLAPHEIKQLRRAKKTAKLAKRQNRRADKRVAKREQRGRR